MWIEFVVLNNVKRRKCLRQLELSSLRSQLNWNDGMMEYWNDGMAPFGQNLAPLRSAIGMLEDGKFFNKIPPLRFSIPVFHHSIIPGWKKNNGCLGIPYYQHFVEFPIYQIKWKEGLNNGGIKI